MPDASHVSVGGAVPSRKTIVITGASDGIGAAAARRLSRDGHDVVVIGRSPERTHAVARSIGANAFTADFGDLASVRDLAEQLLVRYPVIDVLANNAGGVFGNRQITGDGFERTLQVDHLAPFLLTRLLLPTLITSGATLIQTSSIAARLYGKIDLDDLNNERRYSANKAYGDAKLANILFTRELHRRYESHGIRAAAFHPGLIRTSFAQGSTSTSMRMLYSNPLATPILRTADDGADQLVWLAETEPGTEWSSGGYYEKRRVPRRVNPQMYDAALAEALWEKSSALCGFTEA